MNAIPDRRKLRRASFWKIGSIYAKAVGRVMLTIGFAVCLAIAGMCVLYWMGIDLGHSHSREPFLPAALFFLFVFVGASWLNGHCLSVVEKAQEEAAALSVSPVTANALPPEEILLRGSEPTVSLERETLLRPARESPTTDLDQLLRPKE